MALAAVAALSFFGYKNREKLMAFVKSLKEKAKKPSEKKTDEAVKEAAEAASEETTEEEKEEGDCNE